MRKLIVPLFAAMFLSVVFPVFAAPGIPAGYNHSGSTVQTIVGNPSGASKGHSATNDTCPNSPFHSRYLFNFQNNVDFTPKNFGDPVCDYTLNRLATFIKQTDPGNNSAGIAHVLCWYNVIILHESSYDPNDEQLNDPYDPAHAWGNFQMGRTGRAGSDDYGNVDWQTQVINAVHHNHAHGDSFDYWSTRKYDLTACSS